MNLHYHTAVNIQTLINNRFLQALYSLMKFYPLNRKFAALLLLMAHKSKPFACFPSTACETTKQ